MLFKLGRIEVSPEAHRLLQEAEQEPAEFLNRHARGDWGPVEESHKEANARAVREGLRIHSAYLTKTEEELWVITEANRSVTVVVLPDEYEF